jgi:hypothetical protein
MQSEAASATPRELALSYPVDVRVEPSHAQLQLDRRAPLVGRLSTVLPKDGQAHELRIVADGYATTTLLFIDVAPPGNIRLEALPEAAEALPVAATATLPALPSALPPNPSQLKNVAAAAPQSSPAAASKRRSRAAPRRHEATARDGVKSVPAAAPGKNEPPPGPQVQIIGGDTPKIQIID